MRKYCKAYILGDLRRFDAWAEQAHTQDQELADDSVCYLYDDFVVVQSPFQEESVLFDTVTPAWKDFCRDHLQFTIPEDLRYAYEQVSE
ncbi:MAG TPA: hypothetical protein VH593_11575 [Ktedonobacteraceae bacterium]